jgi:hypothetical protein
MEFLYGNLPLLYIYGVNAVGCITSLLIAFQDFLVSGVSVQVSGLAIPDT